MLNDVLIRLFMMVLTNIANRRYYTVQSDGCIMIFIQTTLFFQPFFPICTLLNNKGVSENKWYILLV